MSHSWSHCHSTPTWVALENNKNYFYWFFCQMKQKINKNEEWEILKILKINLERLITAGPWLY